MYKKKVTLSDVSKGAGVSKSAASIVLSGRSDIRIGQAARKRILDTAASLGYYAASFSNKHRGTVYFVHSGIENAHIGTSFFVNTAHELKILCNEKNYNFIEIDYTPENAGVQMPSIIAAKPLAAVTNNYFFYQEINKYEVNIPLFLLQSGGMEKKAVSYLVDDREAGRLAGKHLLQCNCRRAAVVMPEHSNRCRRERTEGFLETFSSQGCTADVIELKDLSLEKAEMLCKTAKKNRYDCWFFFSDALAIAGIRGLHAAGINIPAHAKIIGTDNLYWGRYTYPSLTTMDLQEKIFAQKILRDIDAAASGEKITESVVIIPVKLIKRESA